MDRVAFVTTEDGDDLIVSFVIIDEDPSEVQSLILMRTPKYEHLLDASERGVQFSDERNTEEVDEFVRSLHLDAGVLALTTDRADYTLDLSRVDPAELAEARRILKRMNFDASFELSIR